MALAAAKQIIGGPQFTDPVGRRAVLTSPGVIQPALVGEWAQFERICAQHRLTGNAIPDAWIAAAAQFNHLHLVTFDKGFRKLLKSSMLTVLKAG